LRSRREDERSKPFNMEHDYCLMSAYSLDFLLCGQKEEVVVPVSGMKSSKAYTESAKTLESYHTSHLAKLRDEKIQLESYKKDIEDKKRRLAEIDNEFNSPAIRITATDIQILTGRQSLEQEIKDLQEKIAKLESGEAEIDYFLRVGDILFSYTDAQERIATGERFVESASAKKERVPANSIYSYFSSNLHDDSMLPTGGSGSSSDARGIATSTTKASNIKNDIGFKRDKALETYLTALDPDSLQSENALASSITQDYGTCAVCDTEMFFNETFLDCPGCGYRDFILIDSEKPSYKDPPREMSYYAYKKINHLNEWLAQFQAKETTEISPAVLDVIRAELKKERITDMSKLKPSKLKEVIKKLKLNRCNDHVAHVLNRLNGISAPVLSREVEEKIRFMFKEIQFSFVKHCPKKRSNFLSYSFVLYKFCELLELDEYLPCFPLLKSREKLYMQDKIWQKICEDMGWEFIRTV